MVCRSRCNKIITAMQNAKRNSPYSKRFRRISSLERFGIPHVFVLFGNSNIEILLISTEVYEHFLIFFYAVTICSSKKYRSCLDLAQSLVIFMEKVTSLTMYTIWPILLMMLTNLIHYCWLALIHLKVVSDEKNYSIWK